MAAARMMRWRPWPPGAARKYRVRLVVRRMEGSEKGGKATAVVRWKGAARRAGLGALRRAASRRNCTRGEEVGEGGGVVWDEEFETVCAISGAQPWEVVFQVFNDMNQGPKDKACVIGTASLNLAEFTSTAEEIEINLQLLPAVLTTESHPSLHVTLSLLELGTFQEPSEILQRLPAPVSPLSDSLPSEKDDLSSAFKAGLRKVKILTEFVSARKSKKKNQDDEASEGRSSARSDDIESIYPFDTDSLDDDPDEGESRDGKDDSSIRKSFGYGTLASANYVGNTSHTHMIMKGDYEDWVYYSHHRSDVGCPHTEEKILSVSEQYIIHKSILPWKKRKFNMRSPKTKGEPLLKRIYGDEGGDDIDYDRRQLSSSDESLSMVRRKVDGDGTTNHLSASEFGDDSFEVGSWEAKKLVSRDGHMKLSTQVFFASIDQRSERAAGESACTALVAVIADWFQTNNDLMPIKSQLDSLIREGSLKWRNLCKNETYRERFPDKHFDLETVLQAKICPLSVVSEKSFIGFFHPEATGDNSGFDFLQGAMSFDSIWDEISRAASECPADGSTHLYIVSWNDHFFVLKVERNAYYILDTLGERLYEGCNQAYVLKFDDSTSIHKIRSENKDGARKRVKSGTQQTQEKEDTNAAGEEELVCRGKESCKEYIKSFLAAIPIRELQADIKKGLMASTLLHQRLQIEFHYTETSKNVSELEFKPVAENTASEFPSPAEAFTQTLAVEVV